MTTLTTALAASLLAAALCAPARALDKPPVNAGPYVPSPKSVVSDMLTLAEVGPNDFVIDLGSGDGRIVLTAAKVFGARGFGVDIDEKLVREANEAARNEGVADQVKFTTQDLFKTDISQATVLTMYLLPHTVNMLKEKLLRELKPGTKIISHDYSLADWKEEKSIHMDLEDKVAISGVTTTLIWLYRVPARIAGAWRVRLPAQLSRDAVRMELATFRTTLLKGKARIRGRDVIIDGGSIQGNRVSFQLHTDAGSYEFTGTVKDGAMQGIVEGGGVKSAWSAAPAQ
ncbi:MAG: class I SAM-dependent methyltransferase [Betaproteobacteria bacterium]|nr:class I SAM-dependent methyltransferase [Betaproteobacteria bacterium]